MRFLIRIVLLLVVLSSVILVADAYRAVQAEARPAILPATLNVPAGSNWSATVAHLRTEDWFDAPRDGLYWRLYGRLRGDDASRIKAGEYRIERPLSVGELLDKLVRGDVVQHRLTLIEGWTLVDALNALRAHSAVRQTLPEDDADALAVLRERHSIAAEHPEGWYLPETYRFVRGTDDVVLLDRAHDAMQRQLAAAWEQRHEDVPLKTPEDLLVLASIVEKETGHAPERAQVAGVFARRLRIGMRLQTDPTVLYGRDSTRSGRLLTRDLRSDTPYNTYTRGGLPPTPICLPGTAALNAAAQPADGTALYFVSRNDGTHVFSDTLTEHNRAVQRFQRGGAK